MSSTRGSTRSSTSGHSHSNKKNRGPKHGHGNKGKGGGTKFYNLIDDSKTTNTNTGSNMATFIEPALTAGTKILKNTLNTKNNTKSDKQWLTDAYKTYLNREPVFGGKLADGRDDPGDADYWLGQLASGASRSSINTHLNTSPEAKELRSEIFRLAEDPNAPTDVTERFNLARTNTALGGSAMAEAKKNYTGMFTDYSKTPDPDPKLDPKLDPKPDPKPTPTPSAGLTLDDLNSWWEGKQNNQPNQFDQFKEFMGMLGDMPGMGGGYGYGYPSMGYGGYAPGGVAAANPYGNMMSFMNAFKNMGSGGSDSKLASSSLTK